MASQGPLSPGTIVNDDSVGIKAWNTPSDAKESNNSYALAFSPLGAPTLSNYLKATNFGFSIPTDATIDGIKVEIERSDGVSETKDDIVSLVKGGAVVGDNAADTSIFWPSSDTIKTYGGPLDLWFVSWTPADINASDFGVALSVDLTTEDAIASVDHIRITVYYIDGGTSYSFSMDSGVYTLTEKSSTFLADRKISFKGTYSLIGNAISLVKNIAGGFILRENGERILRETADSILTELNRAYSLFFEKGLYALTGNIIGLAQGLGFAIASGAYALTGNTIGLFKELKLAIANGTYTLTGNAINMIKGYIMSIASGTYTLTGKAMNFFLGFAMAFASGVYTLTGNVINFSKNFQLLIDAGSYVLTGKPFSLLAGRLLTLAKGTYTLTGKAIGLFRGFTIVVVKGTYTLTGSVINWFRTYILHLNKGTYTLTGKTISLLKKIGEWVLRAKPTSSWGTRTKPSTNFTKRTKPTTTWTKRIKP